MNLEVDVCELGKILKEIEKNYELNIIVIHPPLKFDLTNMFNS